MPAPRASEESATVPGASAPPIRRSPRRPLTLVACGVVLAGLLLVVVMSLDRAEKPPPREQLADVTELVPERLSAEEIEEGSGSIDQAIGEMPAGGWIQIADDDGALAQQYRFERLDPRPDGMGPGWIRMVAPQFEIYGSDGSVVTLTGDSALAYAPNNAVESGTLSGNVVIERHDHVDSASRGAPTLVITTNEARFDNVFGDVRCDDDIRVETPGGAFDGRGLTLLVNDQDDLIQRLEVQDVRSIRLAARTQPEARGDTRHGAPDDAPDPRGPRPRDGAPPAPDPTVPARADDDAGSTTEPPTAPEPAVADDEVFYVLTLHDDVVITQGGGTDRRTAEGTSLSLFFTFRSEAIARGLAGAGDLRPAARRRGARGDELAAVSSPSTPRRLTDLLIGAALGAAGDRRNIAPPPGPDDTIITCSGPMTMRPAEPGERLASPRDARLRLEGAPVVLRDHGARAEATCSALEYHAQDGLIALLGLDGRGVDVITPQLVAEGEAFHLRPAAHRGGFTGRGTAQFTDDEATDAAQRTLDVAWSEGVDLVFDDAAETLGPLRRLDARGDVAVSDGVQSLWSQLLTVHLSPRDPEADPNAGADRELASRIDTIVAETAVSLALEDGARVFADRLDVDAISRRATLSGSDVRLVSGGDVIDRARLVTVDETSRIYTLDGEGRYRRFGAPVRIDDDERGPGIPALLDALSEELRVTWREGVRLAPAGAERPGGPADAREARFRGDVAVASPELTLSHADEMRVAFMPDADGKASIGSIDAVGDVHARSVGEPGEIQTETLHVDLGRNDRGETVPRLLTASGGVHVADEQQDLWATALEVTFRDADVADAAVDDAAVDDRGEFARARVELGTILADGGVQLRLAGGELVFADRLRADALAEEAELTGESVLVLSADFALTNVTRLTLDRGRGRHEVDGPGAFLAFAAPIGLPDVTGPIDPPAVDGVRTLEAVWTSSAVYEENADGGGRLTLGGRVHGESRPNPLEINTIDAEAVALDFAVIRGDDSAAVTAPEARRELTRLVATGDAKLENRTWLREDHDGPPRVFYVSGPRVEYDQRTLEARVDGQGELLVQDLDVDRDPSAAAPTDAFGRSGTTLLRWRDRLHMRRKVDELFTILTQGDVECIHQALDGMTSTLTGQEVETTLVREGVSAAAAPVDDATIRFGGPMELKRVYGTGGIMVHTPKRDLACDEFDYNLMTGIAQVNAAPGSMVYIRNRGSSAPMRHERLLWDMANDTITIFRGGAAGSP